MTPHNGTAARVLAALEHYDLRPEGDNQYRSNSPLRPGSNSHAFTITIGDDDEHGAYRDHVSGDKGSLYDLADRLGVERPGPGASASTTTSKRAYESLADYCGAAYVEAFKAAGWSDVQRLYDISKRLKRPALAYQTRTGLRYRFTDGEKPTYAPATKGQRACWYGLERAINLGGTLILCNGASSVVTAQAHGVPAIAIEGSGESNIAKHLRDDLLDELREHYAAGRIVVALDCDQAGRRAAAAVVPLLREAGYDAQAIDLCGTDGYDLRDFCRLHGDNSLAALSQCQRLALGQQPQAEGEPPRPAPYVDFDALRDSAPPVGTFPVEALPAPVRAMVEQVAASTRTEPDLAALLALATIATAVQGKARVRIHDSWEEELCLYVAAVAQPGDGKSPVFNLMTNPIRRRAAKLREAHAKEAAAYEALSADDKKSEPEPDTHPPRLTTTDTTPERLAALMERNAGKMAVLSAEAGIIGTLAGRYTQKGSSANIDLFLQAWNGEFTEIDRKDPDAPSLYLPRPLLSMGITMQPVVLESIRKNKELGARGLWDRFLVVYPAASQLSLRYDAPAVPADVRAAWADLVDALLDLPQADEAPSIPIRPDALDYWTAQLRPYEALGDGEYAPIRGLLKKGMSQLPRLAALLLIADNPAARLGSLAVTVEHAQRAWACYDALIPHFLKVAGQTTGVSGVIADARKLAAWIADYAPNCSDHIFSKREAQRKSPLRESVRLGDALDYLVEAGWLAAAEMKNSRARRYLVPAHSPIFATVATPATDGQGSGATCDGNAENAAAHPVADDCDKAATPCDKAATVEPPPATNPELSQTVADCRNTVADDCDSDISDGNAEAAHTVATVATVAERTDKAQHDAALIAVAANDDTATHIRQVRTREWLLHGPNGASSYLLHQLRGVGIAPAVRDWIEAEKRYQRQQQQAQRE